MVPIGLFCRNLFPIVGATLSFYTGIRMTLTISLLMIIASHFILYTAANMIIANIAMGIQGAGIGLMIYLSINNAGGFFPEKRGMISGIYNLFFGISPLFFTLLADYIDQNSEEDPAEKTAKFLKLQITFLCFLSIIPILTIFQYEKEGINVEEMDNKKKKKDKEPIKQVFKDKKFYLTCIMIYCLGFYGYALSNTKRGFATEMKIDMGHIKAEAAIFATLNAFSRLFWGIIFDKFGAFYPYVMICIFQIICSSTIYFSAFFEYGYLILTLLSSIPYSGQATLFPPIVNKSFGTKNGGFLLGIVSFFISGTALSGGILCTIILKDGEPKRYLIVFLTATLFSVIGLIILFFVGDTPFQYHPEDDEEEYLSLSSTSDVLLEDFGINSSRISLQKY